MATTTYNLVLASGEEARYSRKDAAIKAGEKSGGEFTVQTGSGNVVHQHLLAEAPADVVEVEEEDLLGTLEPVEDEAEEVAPEEAPEEAEAPEEPAFEAVVNYRDHGPKHFWKALGRSAVEAFADDEDVVVSFNNRDFSVHFKSDDSEVAAAQAELVGKIWDEAMDGLKAFKKTDVYKAADKKTTEGKAEAYALEQGFLTRFVNDALAEQEG